jgi:hypothetical protein
MGIEGYFSILVGILFVGLASSVVFLLYRRRRSALFTLAITLGLGGVWYSLLAVDNIANKLIFPDDTIYAAGYSDRSFREVQKGQGPEVVLSLVGEPLNRSLSWDEESEYWYYSRHGPRFDNYWNKIVVFDAHKGHVIRKVDELYSD